MMMAIVRAKYSGSSPSVGSPGGTVLTHGNESWYKKKSLEAIRFETWNVKTMARAGKLQNTIQEMKRLKVQVMGISEMRWPGSGAVVEDEYKVYYSGTGDNTHKNGVGIIMNKYIASCVTNFIPISDRIMLIQLTARPTNLNFIQVYFPTTDHTDAEVEEVYAEIENIIRTIPKHEAIVIMGDFNAKIGKGKSDRHIGEYGLGERNDRGDMLNNFAGEHNMIVTNTFFKQHPRRLYTWKSPDKKTRNQIDYVLINERFRNSINTIKTYPGADVYSDHNPLIGNMRIRLKKVNRKTDQKYDYRRLKATTVRNKVKEELKAIGQEQEEFTVAEKLENLREKIEKIKEEHLKPEREMKKTWMTEDIMRMMEERRKHKNKTAQYKVIQKEIRRKIRAAKEQENLEKCIEIEKCQEKGDVFNMHKKVKEMAGTCKKKVVSILTDEHGKIIIDEAEIKKTWEDYIKELFNDVRSDPSIIDGNDGPEILEEEVKRALTNSKERKALGPDGIPTEILKLFEGDNLKWLTTVFNQIYDSGSIPREWLKSEFVTLPKKQSARKCNDFRTISLMNHLLKIFLKIIHGRIYNRCEEQVSDSQFGFRRAVGTREALFSIQVLFQRCRDVSCPIYACFIDYKKAFDRVQHVKMIEVLQKTGIDAKDLRIIRYLYWNQVASVKLEDHNTGDIQIMRGVRQGCVLSPVIFNVYSEFIFREALQNTEAGILLNGKKINNIRYADDTVIFSDNLSSLQTLMDNVTKHSRDYGLDINISKTKFMVISKKQNTTGNVTIDGTLLERVKDYTYLGTNLNEDWDHSKEIRIRIEKARAMFNRIQKVFKSHVI
uniref:Craniofacial development protein 2 n=1 Tax=Cacopsylla melanoneura TaxID=428564 RepID=A0A8D8PQH9_9HEMI